MRGIRKNIQHESEMTAQEIHERQKSGSYILGEAEGWGGESRLSMRKETNIPEEVKILIRIPEVGRWNEIRKPRIIGRRREEATPPEIGGLKVHTNAVLGNESQF